MSKFGHYYSVSCPNSSYGSLPNYKRKMTEKDKAKQNRIIIKELKRFLGGENVGCKFTVFPLGGEVTGESVPIVSQGLFKNTDGKVFTSTGSFIV